MHACMYVPIPLQDWVQDVQINCGSPNTNRNIGGIRTNATVTWTSKCNFDALQTVADITTSLRNE